MPDVLPRGSTGFGANVERLDQRKVRALVFAVARQHGWNVEQARELRMATFDVLALHRERNNALWVLLHRHVPLVAVVARDPGDHQQVEVVDWHPLDSPAVSQIGWRLLSAQEAAAVPTDAQLADLTDDELPQVQYWKPGTVAQVAFNTWD